MFAKHFFISWKITTFVPKIVQGYYYVRKYFQLSEENCRYSFRREIREETWCEIDNIKEIWKVVEKVWEWEQVSYCFVWKIINKREPHFTQKEIERWYELRWLKLDDALSLIKDEETETGDARLMRERELYILEKSYLELDEYIDNIN